MEAGWLLQQLMAPFLLQRRTAPPNRPAKEAIRDASATPVAGVQVQEATSAMAIMGVPCPWRCFFCAALRWYWAYWLSSANCGQPYSSGSPFPCTLFFLCGRGVLYARVYCAPVCLQPKIKALMPCIRGARHATFGRCQRGCISAVAGRWVSMSLLPSPFSPRPRRDTSAVLPPAASSPVACLRVNSRKSPATPSWPFGCVYSLQRRPCGRQLWWVV